MKIVIFFLIAVIFYVARILATYHENSLFKKHIKLKHRFSKLILTGKVPTLKTKVERDKLLIQGIVLYALCIFTLFFCIYQLYLCPVIEEDILLLKSHRAPGYYSGRGTSAPLVVHTYNDAISLLMCWATFTLEAAMLFAEGMKAIYNINSSSTGNLIFGMIANLFMTIVFLCLFYLTILRIITL